MPERVSHEGEWAMKIRDFGIELASVALMLPGGAALAEAAGPVASLEEVLVTASKREEKLHDVAMSVTVVGGEDLLRRQESGYTDFAAQVPGLSIEAIDAGTNRVILRGQNVGSVGATVATTVDDIPFFMSGAQADGSFFSANIDTYDLQRVEVLRGPQGTLYGAAAEGGLLKYVTNAPNLRAYEGAVVVGGETVDGGQAAASIKGLVNLPFWDNKAALRVSAVEQSLPGWIDNPFTGQKDVNHGDKYSLRSSLLVVPTEELTIRLTAFNQGLKVRADNSVAVVGAAATPATPPGNQFDLANGLSRAAAVNNVIENDLSYYALNLQYALHAMTLMSATSYGQIRERSHANISDSNLAPGVTYADALGGVYGQAIVIQADQLEYVHKFNEELRLTSNPGAGLFGNTLDWQVGGFFTRETTLLQQPYDARSASDVTTILAPALGGASVPAEYKETAFFADATYHFSSAFDVELGGRNTSTKQTQTTTFQCCVLYGAGATFAPIDSSESARTWSVAPRWHVTPDTLVYARVATGFRPGGPNIPTPTLPTPPSFMSDSTRNYEIGLRTDLLGKRISVDIAVFDIKWQDVQILGIVQTPTGPVGINGNSGKAESKGVEWNLTWRPLDGLSLAVLGAYTDAALKSDAPGLGALSGDKLPYVPDVSNTVNLDYNWQAFGSYSAFAGASWTYTGTRYSAFSPSVSVIEPHVKLPTYNTLRLQTGVDNGHYSAQLYGNNLTNARGITEYANQGGANQTGLATFIQPRTIGVQFGAKF